MAMLAACAGPRAASAGMESVPATAGAPSLTLHRVGGGTPAPLEDAAIRAAFDADAAAELIDPAPPGIDYAVDALLCVYLGQRATGGWALVLQTAELVDGELRIRGRETRPRGTVTQALTYPGDCATISRAALPAGELVVRADDTISDERIVDGTIEVPDAEGAG